VCIDRAAAERDDRAATARRVLLAQAGVARISHGPSAWFHAMAAVESAARGVYAPVE
jgi:2-methylisocitrate lyase-like PEP mutase family enzyme